MTILFVSFIFIQVQNNFKEIKYAFFCFKSTSYQIKSDHKHLFKKSIVNKNYSTNRVKCERILFPIFFKEKALTLLGSLITFLHLSLEQNCTVTKKQKTPTSSLRGILDMFINHDRFFHNSFRLDSDHY